MLQAKRLFVNMERHRARPRWALPPNIAIGVVVVEVAVGGEGKGETGGKGGMT